MLNIIVEQEIDCLVGIPVQLLALARHPAAAMLPAGRLRSVLLSADYVPDAIVREISRVWGAAVFNHYGMTETGLGGGVECAHRCGCHLREADLYFEVIDPESGTLLLDGEPGELVVTTLTRKGMPLIRYRTGDLARLSRCPAPAEPFFPGWNGLLGGWQTASCWLAERSWPWPHWTRLSSPSPFSSISRRNCGRSRGWMF